MTEISTSFETILYEERGAVGWITLNRPQVYNAFNSNMIRELSAIYSQLRKRDEVRVIVITGAGDKAFCSGADRDESVGAHPSPDSLFEPVPPSPFLYKDVGDLLGPKRSGLWKPMIAAVNGLACGGAFYILGEVEFMIAADNATFFDPHLTFGATPVYEPILMKHAMPFQEVMRMSLMGSSERISAARAFQIGLVSEVVPAEELKDRAQWAAEVIASHATAPVQGTLRALWAAREMSRHQATSIGDAFLMLGNQPESTGNGQREFEAGKRVEWRLR